MSELLPRQVLRCPRIATLAGAEDSYGLVEDGAVAIEDGWIRWVGPAAALPPDWLSAPAVALNGLLTPALVDCHTHLVYAGNRAREFERRLEGASYAQIAQEGGGILSTVRETRAADVAQLVEAALPRLDRLRSEGVRTVEIKSGYGLSIPSELAMLRAARRLQELRPVRVRTSYLAAHAVPPEYAGRPDVYIDEVVLPGLEQAHAEGLVDAVDGFCEHIAFTPMQIARVFEHATGLGIPVRLHAEQLSDQGGAQLAARFGALSADHLEYLSAQGIDALAASGTVATLLPGAFYTLRETRTPPVEALRAAGVPMAVATDCNPGSSPLQSILIAMNMACTLFRLTPAEALAGVTRNAARALGLQDEIGRIAPGLRAEFALWNVTDPAELTYELGARPLSDTFPPDTP